MKNDNVAIVLNERLVERRIGWDLLRIFLTLFVFAFHANGHLHCSFGFLTDYISVGAFCMTGFFMLSGAALYLTYGDLDFDKKTIFKYYKKRLISIIPLYFMFMLLFYWDSSFVVDDLILLPLELLGLQSLFVGSFSFSHNSGTWFVSCLLICYYLFPFFVKLIRDLTKKQIVYLGLFLIILDIYANFVTSYFEFGELYSTPFLRIVQFVLGCIIGVMLKKTNKY